MADQKEVGIDPREVPPFPNDIPTEEVPEPQTKGLFHRFKSRIGVVKANLKRTPTPVPLPAQTMDAQFDMPREGFPLDSPSVPETDDYQHLDTSPEVSSPPEKAAFPEPPKILKDAQPESPYAPLKRAERPSLPEEGMDATDGSPLDEIEASQAESPAKPALFPRTPPSPLAPSRPTKQKEEYLNNLREELDDRLKNTALEALRNKSDDEILGEVRDHKRTLDELNQELTRINKELSSLDI